MNIISGENIHVLMNEILKMKDRGTAKANEQLPSGSQHVDELMNLM